MAQAIRKLEGWKAGSHAEDDHLLIAQVMLRAALERRESRGAHYRLDRPEPAQGRPERSYFKPARCAAEILRGASSRVA